MGRFCFRAPEKNRQNKLFLGRTPSRQPAKLTAFDPLITRYRGGSHADARAEPAFSFMANAHQPVRSANDSSHDVSRQWPDGRAATAVSILEASLRSADRKAGREVAYAFVILHVFA